ncbi:MAG: Gfo/Idh/MocA family oxidoreductase, partial [Candidatus Omnitrophica bacterium]|nr:Gfo/Idh/MocA family oxidoreductase [Candidatus Omnitrophota bacterium]
MSKKALQVGVIGYGYWGPNLVRNFSECEETDLVMIADLQPERLKKLKSRYPAVQTIRDPLALIRSAKIEAVAIATPLKTHYALARAALEHGKHVLIEKPMTASAREAEALVRLADKRGLKILVDHIFVYSGAGKCLKEHFEELGEPRYFDSTRVNLGIFRDDTNVIWDLAPHDLSILLNL